MVWGSGSALGVLALLGYAVFVCGAVLLWANRIDVPLWVNDEFGAVRRGLVRHAFSVSFHGLREELAGTALPTNFIRRLARHSRRLLSIGLMLFLLDSLV
jgi:hypothetical protein